MFVFSSRDIPHIIETVITTIEPARSRSYKPIPAYVLFLSARFAHNFSTPELLEELLEATVTAIRSVTKIKPDDMALTAYWISNTSSFIHFLRKDAGLRHTSEAYQEKLEMLLQDMVHTIIQDAERRMEQILEPAMLEHDTIMGLDEVRFQSVWAFNFWRGIGSGGRTNKRASAPPVPSSQSRSTESLRRTSLQAQRPSSPTQRSITPRTVTTMMSSLLFVMQIYDVHPEIIYYVIAQLLYYISCEVFNLMVENRKFLSRSKALQTRLNLSILEDWLRNNQLPSRLTDQLAALVQLLQLLQVLSQQSDLTTWIETRKKVELLNPAQVKHVVSAYRYEVKEQRLPAEVTKYVLQVVADTEKVRRQEAEAASSGSESSSRRASSQISGSRAASIFEAEENRMDKARRTRSGSRSGDSNTERDEEDADQMSLTMNSKIWNHFLMPKNLAARDGGIERVFVPQIPEDVMSLLDSKTYF
ncbi:DIL domain-containing protein [Gamsiella multidivaricata]|uniref:DIL domain-containing protein n=1 Tax=Gamsiella multidivaricata TaxID=101098 RepID=UPI00221EB8FD|nr:DIL domain-containing protein [Gamsiella multidivaricata]KAI7831548.1 DIL domain-containing protein [Gamsiella multidivaricata]